MNSYSTIYKAPLLVVLLFFLDHPDLIAQSGLQRYTPSVMLLPGHWQFKNNSNYYIQTKQFGPDGGKVPTGRGRESYYTMTNQFLYGVSDRFNIGFDVWVKSVNLEYTPRPTGQPSQALGPR